MAKEKVVILGGRGMLGTDLAAACKERDFDVVVYDLPDFDMTDPLHLQQALKNTKMVVNCAAYTNVEKAESQADAAYKINAHAAGSLGEFAKKNGIWVLHTSTDFVFDGKGTQPYTETDEPNPISVYGKSKLAGENLLAQSGCHNCIVRLEWTYGLNGNNFVTKLIAASKQRKELNVVDDQIGSPTATTEVAKAICILLEKKPEGIFHFAASGYVSRFEMARCIFDKLAIPTALKSCKTSDYPSAAARPLNSRFDCRKIMALLGEPIEQWQESLEHFLRKL
jgi:dTDP-4-dehydrorhamnose reductase